MYRPLPLYIGLRYMRARKRNQLISFVSLISVLGIGLGVLVMIAVLSVINASTSTMRAEMLKSIPHASLAVPDSLHQGTAVDPALLQALRGQDSILGAAPYMQGEAWLRYRDTADFIQLRGVDPLLEPSVNAEERQRFPDLMQALAGSPNGILLGTGLAARLGVLPGDSVDLTALSSLTAQRQDQTRSFRVLGVSDFGFYGNRDTALVSLSAARQVFSSDAAASELRLRLRLHDPLQAQEALQQAIAVLPAGSHDPVSWQQSQASLFNALRMEKRMTGFMLLMIVIIGAVNIVSTLVMVVADKRADIAILRTMGADRRSIMAVFMAQGLGTGIVGTLGGTVLGVLLARNLGTLTLAFDELVNRWLAPDRLYLISHLRAELMWGDVVLVAGGALLISLLATVYPAYRATRVEAADVLRYE